jgi:hypothetical protein
MRPMSRTPRSALGLAAAFTAALLAAPACIDGEVLPAATDPAPAAADQAPLQAPPRAGFESVADALVATCGTLDCHGQAGRNLRLYGGHGLRLASADDPGGKPTTHAEYHATYWSTIGLEPEILDQVVREGGASSDRLMMVRKARGEVKHKGGTLMQSGDGLDRCLQRWLAGQPDDAICEEAQPKRPGSPTNP